MNRRRFIGNALAPAGLILNERSATSRTAKSIRARLTVTLGPTDWFSKPIRVKSGTSFLEMLHQVVARYRLNWEILLADPAVMPEYQPRNTATGLPLEGIGLAGLRGEIGYSFRQLFGYPDEPDYREFWLFVAPFYRVDFNRRLVLLNPAETLDPRFLIQKDYNSDREQREPADITDQVKLGPPYIPPELRNDPKVMERFANRHVPLHYTIGFRPPSGLANP